MPDSDRHRVTRAKAEKSACYVKFAESSDLCDQQHNCQAGGEARCPRTIDSA